MLIKLRRLAYLLTAVWISLPSIVFGYQGGTTKTHNHSNAAGDGGQLSNLSVTGTIAATGIISAPGFSQTTGGTVALGTTTINGPLSISSSTVFTGPVTVVSGSSTTLDSVNVSSLGVQTDSFKPFAKFQIGNGVVPNPNTVFTMNVNITTNAAHAIGDYSTVISSAGGGWATYDSTTISTGTGSVDHFLSFQARNAWEGMGTLGKFYSFYSSPALGPNAGLVSTLYHNYVANVPINTAAGIGTQIGYYSEALTSGSANYAFYAVGAPSYFGGGILGTGGSANHAVCWKSDGVTLGWCSTTPTSGSCTCN